MTKEQLHEFKRRYGNSTDEGLAKRFGITLSEVSMLAARHALGKDKRRFAPGSMPRWRAEEVAKLTRLYPDMENEQLALEMGRTTKSVVSKAHDLGLKKSVRRLAEMGRSNVSQRKDRSFSEQC